MNYRKNARPIDPAIQRLPLRLRVQLWWKDLEVSNSVKAQIWGYGGLAVCIFAVMYLTRFSEVSVFVSIAIFAAVVALTKALSYA